MAIAAPLGLSACAGELSPSSEFESASLAAQEETKEIVGGSATTITAHPWQISLQSSGGSHFCGGSIVSPEWIVTAQHCVEGSSAASLRVVAGVSQLSQSGSGQRRSVSQIVRFAGYVSPERGKDIALLRLSQPLDLSGTSARAIGIVRAADVAAGLTNGGVTAAVTGWGTLSAGGSSPNTLQAVTVPIVSNAQAQSQYPQETITSDQLAAGQAGRDSCQGDSGGPLTVVGPNGPLLAGVVSWGYGCGDARFPGMYARVSSFESWLVQNGAVPSTPGPIDPDPIDPDPVDPTPTGDVTLFDQSNISGAQGSFQHAAITVPAGATSLTVTLGGGTGDADLYVRQGSQPTTTTFTCRSWNTSNTESCVLDNPGAGTWFVSVQGYAAFSGVRLTAVVRAPVSGDPDPTPGTRQTLASDDFSSLSWSGGTGFSGAWARAGDTALLTTGAARLRRATGDITRNVDVSGATGLQLSFSARIGQFESSDTALVRVSANGGASYTTVRTFTQADSTDSWNNVTVDLSGFDGATNLVIRFDAQMNATTDNYYVDDVVISGVQ